MSDSIKCPQCPAEFSTTEEYMEHVYTRAWNNTHTTTPPVGYTYGCAFAGCFTDSSFVEVIHHMRTKHPADFSRLRPVLVPEGQQQARSSTVNHPAHYGGDVPHEVVKCLAAWGLESDALLWNAVKYIARAGKKTEDPLEDLNKAMWYLQRRIQALASKAAAVPLVEQ